MQLLLSFAVHLLSKSSFLCIGLGHVHYFKPMCILACEMGFLDTAHRWVLTFYPICQSVSFDWAFSLFAFKVNIVFLLFVFRVNIVMCEFDTAILILAGCFAR